MGERNFCLCVFCARSLQGRWVGPSCCSCVVHICTCAFSCTLSDWLWVIGRFPFSPFNQTKFKEASSRGNLETSIQMMDTLFLTPLDGCFTGAVQIADARSNHKSASVPLWFLCGCQRSRLAGAAAAESLDLMQTHFGSRLRWRTGGGNGLSSFLRRSSDTCGNG